MTAYQLFNITPSETQFFPPVHHSNVAKCSQRLQLSAIWLSYKQLEKMAIRANCPFPCLQPRATVLDITAQGHFAYVGNRLHYIVFLCGYGPRRTI